MISDSIDDFFVSYENSKSLSEHLNCLDAVNQTMRTLPKVSQTKKMKYKLYKSLIESQEAFVLYRKRNDASDLLINYWLSDIKKIAYIYGKYNNLPEFKGISKDFIKELILLSPCVDNIFKIEGILAEKGIIFVVEPSIQGLKTDGVVFINENNHAVISLSLRYSRLDNFWFTLVHELCHLLLHEDHLINPIIEDLDNNEQGENSLIERQANLLARDLLIPRNLWRNCPCKYDISNSAVIDFAKQLEIHPAIVAGRIRYENNNYSLYQKIIDSVNIREIFSK
ncbi:ImmA/IrrE family metallo-endopeptidase [Acinetobacter tibetensis]|uniref:ImmA/IrrE family metallo-endopeptidase n=1 Tax=Acinetobacter tibetensis TaxID=2943497 RepID=UPI003A4DDC7D